MDHTLIGRIENIISTKVLDSIDELLLVVIGNTYPVGTKLWEETMDSPNPHRALRSKMAIISGYGIGRNTDVATHMAYLRHAKFYLHSVFYRSVVPNGTDIFDLRDR